MVVQNDKGRTYSHFFPCQVHLHLHNILLSTPALIGPGLCFICIRNWSPKGRHNPFPDWFWVHDSFAWGTTNQSPRNHQRGSNKRYKKEN